MRKLIVAISLLALGASASLADPAADREALMKANGAAMGGLGAFVKGEKPFDAAEALALLNKLSEDAQKMDSPALWPEEPAGTTEASPKIWTEPDAFKAALAKFKADTAAAVAAAPADVGALKAQVGAVGSNCASCHQSFRIKKG